MSPDSFAEPLSEPVPVTPMIIRCTDCGADWHSQAAHTVILRDGGRLLCGGTVQSVVSP